MVREGFEAATSGTEQVIEAVSAEIQQNQTATEGVRFRFTVAAATRL